MRASLILSTIVGTIVTGAYWLAFVAVAYGLTAGDYRPGSGPSDGQRSVVSALIWAAGFVGYAIIAGIWRTIDFRLAKRIVAAARELAAGEIAAARDMFGEAIDYSRIRVHRGKYIFFQPARTAMAPNGEIYFPAAVYQPDFSTNVPDTSWLIHELVHVWQHQSGVNVRLAAPFSRNYTYGPIGPATRFADLNIEQQASAVADYYLIQHGYRPKHGSGTVAQYRALVPFRP